jgi:hypothetical protein
MTRIWSDRLSYEKVSQSKVSIIWVWLWQLKFLNNNFMGQNNKGEDKLFCLKKGGSHEHKRNRQQREPLTKRKDSNYFFSFFQSNAIDGEWTKKTYLALLYAPSSVGRRLPNWISNLWLFFIPFFSFCLMVDSLIHISYKHGHFLCVLRGHAIPLLMTGIVFPQGLSQPFKFTEWRAVKTSRIRMRTENLPIWEEKRNLPFISCMQKLIISWILVDCSKFFFHFHWD